MIFCPLNIFSWRGIRDGFNGGKGATAPPQKKSALFGKHAWNRLSTMLDTSPGHPSICCTSDFSTAILQYCKPPYYDSAHEV